MPHPPVSVYEKVVQCVSICNCQAGNVQGHSYRLSNGWDHKTVTQVYVQKNHPTSDRTKAYDCGWITPTS